MRIVETLENINMGLVEKDIGIKTKYICPLCGGELDRRDIDCIGVGFYCSDEKCRIFRINIDYRYNPAYMCRSGLIRMFRP